MKHELWCPLEDMKKERLWYAIVTRDRHGKVVSRERRKSHSFLKAWNQLTFAQITTDYATIVDIDGVGRATASGEYNFRMRIGPGGIRVGTGNTPVAIDDYVLETQIEQGTGPGQMEYGGTTVSTSVVAAPSCYSVVSRTIVNNSGGVITVREAAIYMAIGLNTYCCGIRDVLTAPQAVPDGGAITIDWTIQVTV